jgi:hypothetical protein
VSDENIEKIMEYTSLCEERYTGCPDDNGPTKIKIKGPFGFIGLKLDFLYNLSRYGGLQMISI